MTLIGLQGMDWVDDVDWVDEWKRPAKLNIRPLRSFMSLWSLHALLPNSQAIPASAEQALYSTNASLIKRTSPCSPLSPNREEPFW